MRQPARAVGRPSGVRTRTVTLTLLPAITLVACGENPTAGVDASRIPTSYRMTLHADCGERQLSGDYHLVVRHDRVVEAGPARLVRRASLELSDFPTLRDLVDKADNAEWRAKVDLRVDSHGVPRSLTIDHNPDAVDDEECYTVTGLRRLGD
jgi:hypothetical protein